VIIQVRAFTFVADAWTSMRLGGRLLMISECVKLTSIVMATATAVWHRSF